jgi:uncharacterized repeat protein (TIGR01451 family)
MTKRRWRWILAGLGATAVMGAAALLGAAASPAPAGNRNLEIHLTAAGGLSQVTNGQAVAYTSTAFNPGESNFTHVRFRDPIPTTTSGGQTLEAELAYASCSGKLTPTEFVCDELAQLRKGETATVTIAWKTPAAGASDDCPPSTAACITNTGTWTVKEGFKDQPHSSAQDTFETETVATSLVSPNDPNRAGGYALNPCTDPAHPTLATNPAVGPGNQVASAFCASTLPAGDPLNAGLVIQLSEVPRMSSDPGVTEASEVCVPAPGQSCGTPGYTPWVFSPFATLEFRIDTKSLHHETIDRVYHDGVKVSSKPSADPHVVSIECDSRKKVTTVVVVGSTNGRWVFG